MKKLFTLFAAALCALAVSAKETLPNFTPSTMTFSSWTWINVAQLGQGEVDKETGDDSGVTYFDGSVHDYIVLEYSEATAAKMKLIVQYKAKGTVGQYGPDFNEGSEEVGLNSTGGIIAIKLNYDLSDKIYSVNLQDPGTPGTLNLTDAYFATEEEYLAAKEEAENKEKVLILDGEGTHTMAAGDWGWDSKWFGDTDISAYNTLVIKVKSVTGKGQLVMGDLKVELSATDSPITITTDISAMTSFNQIAYQNIYKSSDNVELPDAETVIVIEEVYLTSKTKAEVDEEIATGINDVVAPVKPENNVRYNLLGVKNGNGIYIMNGKKYMK